METRLLNEFDEFLLWWWNGLAQLVPQHWRDRAKRLKHFLIVRVEDGEIAFEYHGDGLTPAAARCPMNESAPHEKARIQEWLHGLQQSRAAPLILRLPAQQVLVKRLRYPRAALANMREVIGFDIDRQTPFTQADVYYTYDVVRNVETSPNVDIDLLLIPKRDIEPADQFLHSLGLQPLAMDVDNRTFIERQVNLLPTLDADAAKRPVYRRRFALFVTWLALISCIPAKQLLDSRQELERLQSVEANSRAAIGELQSLRDQRAELVQKINYFRRLENDYIPAIKLLNEVTRLLGDGTWVRRFDLKEGRLTLQGESDKASDIPAALDDSSYLSRPRFSSPVTRNNASGKDRFQLTIDVGAAKNQ